MFFFINYNSFRISRPNKNHMKQSDLGKSLDPFPDPYILLTYPDPDGLKTYGSGPGSATLL